MKILVNRLANTTKYVSRLEQEIEELRDQLRKLQGKKPERKEDVELEHELVDFGFISSEQLARCIQEYRERRKKEPNISILKILIEKGYLTTEQIIQYLELKQKKN